MLEDIRDDVASISAAVARLDVKVETIMTTLQKLNGRLVELEQWRHLQEILSAQRAKDSETLLTKRQFIALVSMLGPVSAVLTVVLDRWL